MRDGHRDGHYRSRANRQWLPRPQTVNDDVDDVLSTAPPPFTSKRRSTPSLIAFVTLERDVHKCAPCLERYHRMTYTVLQVRAPIREKRCTPFSLLCAFTNLRTPTVHRTANIGTIPQTTPTLARSRRSCTTRMPRCWRLPSPPLR